MAGKLLVISAEEVKDVLRYEDLIPAMRRALARFSDREGGGVTQPVRSVMPVTKYNGFVGMMPAHSDLDNSMAVKLVSFYPNNIDVSTHSALIVLLNPSNGVPIAVMDGEVITTMRTAAASAAVTKAVFREDPKILAIIGAGTQGHSHYHALTTLYNFTEVRIYSRTLISAEKLASQVTKCKVSVCKTVEEAAKGADIIVLATTSETPLLQADWVKRGAHVIAVGACRPEFQELDPELTNSSVLIVDSREAALVESGDVILSKAEIFAEAGEIILGQKKIPPNKTTVFKSLGIAVEDVVSAKLVYDKICQNNAK